MKAMKILLDLTTHPGVYRVRFPSDFHLILLTEKVTRGAAIITVKRWLPDLQPMSDMVRTFALRLLRRLQKRPEKGVEKPEGVRDGSEDGEMPQEDIVQTEYLPEEVELPARKSQVLQHVELIFALSVKSTEFLDE